LLGLDQAELGSPNGGLSPIRDVELYDELLEVILDRAYAEHQFL